MSILHFMDMYRFFLAKIREDKKIKVSNFSVEEMNTDATVLALFNRMGRHHGKAK